jgi:hypothetical protein
MNGGGQWVFESSGIPFPCEDISHYARQNFQIVSQRECAGKVTAALLWPSQES